jgi:hypothetical protein
MTSLVPPDPDSIEFDLDFDAQRSANAEANEHSPGVKIGGEKLALPVELPVDVLQPLLNLDQDVIYLAKQAIDARASNDVDAIVASVVDMLVAHPTLPRDAVETVTTMARRLFGEEGYEKLVAARLTLPEIGRLAKYLGKRYGVGLGEALRPSESSEGSGTTSRPTSSASTTSTSAKSRGGRAKRTAS